MEALDKLSGILFGVKRPESKEARWNYDKFREYLLLLTRGKDFALSAKNYPEKIALGKNWHDVLNQIRKDSEDGIERFAVIGFKEDKKAIYIQTILLKGSPESVPQEVIDQAVDRARKHGIEYRLGNIHSHPRQLYEKIWGVIQKPKQHSAVLSQDDLFSFLQFPQSVAVLVEGNQNLFVFKCRESTGMPIGAEFLNRDTFKKYWSGRFQDWEMNLKIAERHNLVLYKGQANQDLIKVFPK